MQLPSAAKQGRTPTAVMITARTIDNIADKEKIGCKTLFATHYHELTELSEVCKGVANFNIVAKKRGDDLIFLRKIVEGAADRSYGIEVAKLAGVPSSVVERAKVVLRELEGEGLKAPVHHYQDEENEMQISFGNTNANDIVENNLKNTILYLDLTYENRSTTTKKLQIDMAKEAKTIKLEQRKHPRPEARVGIIDL